MHYLHKILVKLDEYDPEDKEYMIEHARNIAEDMTDGFGEGDVFDWRETDTAGRWSAEYPTNVLFAADDIDKFVSEIEECRKLQRDMMDMHLRAMAPYGYDLQKIVSDAKGSASRPAWDILEIAKLLYGEYMSDSYFYDSYDYTARITDNTIADIKNSPEHWALVMFDYHN